MVFGIVNASEWRLSENIDRARKVRLLETHFEAIVEVIGDKSDDFVDDVVSFGLEYAATVRDDHRHFVEAFREGRIPGITST